MPEPTYPKPPKQMATTQDEELVAGLETICKRIIEHPKFKAAYPRATVRIVSHEGRPGVSIYGQSNDCLETHMSQYLQGAYDMLAYQML